MKIKDLLIEIANHSYDMDQEIVVKHHDVDTDKETIFKLDEMICWGGSLDPVTLYIVPQNESTNDEVLEEIENDRSR